MKEDHLPASLLVLPKKTNVEDSYEWKNSINSVIDELSILWVEDDFLMLQNPLLGLLFLRVTICICII